MAGASAILWRRMSRSLFVLLCVACWTALAGAEIEAAVPVPSAGHRPPVLVLCADDPAEPWIHGIIDGVNGFISTSRSTRPEFYFEFLDRLRLDGARQQQLTRDAIVTKYADTRFELIVVVQREAFTFATSIRDKSWADVPILFASYGGNTSPAMLLGRGDMELTFESNFEAILESAKALFPDTRNVALVWESTDLNRDRIQRAGLTTIEVREASLERFQRVLSSLPPHTIAVLGGAGRQDVAGERPVSPAWPLCEVASAAANSPTFMQGTHFLGCGIVGGPLRDFELVGRALGERIVSRLAGGEAKSEEIPLAAITRTEFDGRQLERWHVSERALPPGSVVRFRGPNLWRDHREQVVGVLVALGVQTLLIVVLILERNRRRVAEAEGQENLMIAARAERQVLTGTLAGAIAHELSQPLASIRLNADAAEGLLRRGSAGTEELLEILQDIRTEDQRASEMLGRHRDMLRSRPLEKRSVDLRATVLESIAILRQVARSTDISIDPPGAGASPVVAGDPVLLQEVVLNLLRNAMDAVGQMPLEQRRIVVTIACSDTDASVTVRDSGPGLPPAVLATLFQPFRTTKSDGMGIGLALSHRIATAHDGTIAASNNADSGATFRLTVPLGVVEVAS
jgi:signal transduction histidine kinase